MNSETSTYEKPGIAGSGAIACGLATAASCVGPVTLLARSDGSAERAKGRLESLCGRLEGADLARISVALDVSELSDCDLVVEAVVEDLEVKSALLREIAAVAPEADLASTTSSLAIGDLAAGSGAPERFFGLHVFNPVTKMKLIEVCLPEPIRPGLRERALAWCEQLGKTAVEVPDQAGFVVNRLLFPYLFDAVRVMEKTGMEPGEIDTCMSLGAAHPMGPLALLDYVGLDVSAAIGETLHADSGDPAHRAPAALLAHVEAGRLGRKSGAGFFTYD